MSCLTDTGVTGKAFPSPCGRPPGGGWKEASPLLPAVPPDGQVGLRALSGQCPRLTPPTLTLKQAPEGRRAVPPRGQRPQVWQREAPGGRGLGPKSQQSWAGDQVSRALPGAGRGPGPLPAQSPDPPAEFQGTASSLTSHAQKEQGLSK